MPLDVREEHELQIEAVPVGLERLERAQIDIQIATAKRYPRSITKFQKQTEEMVTLNPKMAGECFYSLKRTGKGGEVVRIEGPSIRFAELASCAWGNMRNGARVADEDDSFIYGQGTAHDLESNVYVLMETSRRITNRDGRKYNDDMIANTGNAACAIAYRNAVLKVIPKALWLPMYEKARALARGDIKDLETRRKAMVEEFGKLKVNETMICEYLEVKGVADIGLDELLDLRGVYTAISQGDSRVQEVFVSQSKESDGPRRASESKPAAGAPAVTSAKAETKAEPKPKAEPNGLATPEQIEKVQRASMESGFSLYDLKGYLKKHYGTEKVAEIESSKIDALILELKNGGKAPEAK